MIGQWMRPSGRVLEQMAQARESALHAEREDIDRGAHDERAEAAAVAC